MPRAMPSIQSALANVMVRDDRTNRTIIEHLATVFAGCAKDERLSLVFSETPL